MKKIFTVLSILTLFVSTAVLPTAAHAQTVTPDLSAAHTPRGAHLNQTQVTAISGSVIIVFKDKKFYTVNTGAYTDFRRRYWGRTDLSQVSVGNYLNIWGRYTDNTNTALNAYVIRDTSVQEAHDTFTGFVISTTAGGFVLQSDHRGQQTVLVNEDTKLTDKNGNSISPGSITLQDRVVVEGLWDRSTNTIGPAESVKDMSIPH